MGGQENCGFVGGEVFESVGVVVVHRSERQPAGAEIQAAPVGRTQTVIVFRGVPGSPSPELAVDLDVQHLVCSNGHTLCCGAGIGCASG